MDEARLDPTGPVLSLLFAHVDSDEIVRVVGSAGLTIDWGLSERDNYSHKTRKRAYRPRVEERLGQLSATERNRALTTLARFLVEQADLEENLNLALEPTGWLFNESTLVPVASRIEVGAFVGSSATERRAVIVTALSLEAAAVVEHLRFSREETHAQGTIYTVGTFAGDDTEWQVAVAVTGQGNVSAAVEVERAVNHFNPSVILLVGVAGGLKDVGIGDVVVASRVYGYESGKANDTFLPRPVAGLSTYAALQRARAESESGYWTKRIRGAPSEAKPRALIGPIVAGEKVISSTASATYKFIREQYSDALAVEMEGIGFHVAAHANFGVQALAIRGVSDLVEGKAEADAAGTQERAAANAAAFAFQFLATFRGSSLSVVPANDPSFPHTQERLDLLGEKVSELANLTSTACEQLSQIASSATGQESSPFLVETLRGS